jgi:alpha-galactosidase
MMGRFGLELDLGKLDEETLDTLAKEIAQYKRYQQDIHYGELYRLRSPYKGRTAAYEIVSSERVLVFIMNIAGAPCQAPLRLKLQGLEPDKQYKGTDTGLGYEGRTLMGAGIPLDTRKDHTAWLTVFEICP